MGKDEDKTDSLAYAVTIEFEPSLHRRTWRHDFCLDGGETIYEILDMLVGPMLRTIGYSDKTICDGMKKFIDNLDS